MRSFRLFIGINIIIFFVAVRIFEHVAHFAIRIFKQVANFLDDWLAIPTIIQSRFTTADILKNSKSKILL